MESYLSSLYISTGILYLINAVTVERFHGIVSQSMHASASYLFINYFRLAQRSEIEVGGATCSFVPTARDRIITITSKGFKGKQSRFCESSPAPVVKTHANIFIDYITRRLSFFPDNFSPFFQYQSEGRIVKSSGFKLYWIYRYFLENIHLFFFLLSQTIFIYTREKENEISSSNLFPSYFKTSLLVWEDKEW